MNVEQGFMVFRSGKQGGKPRRIHPTIGEAYEEASRLALLEAEKGSADPFLILEVVGGVRAVGGKVEPLTPARPKTARG